LDSANTEPPAIDFGTLNLGGGHDKYAAEFWTTYLCWSTLSTMSATQFVAPVRHSKFYIDDGKPFVTLLVRYANIPRGSLMDVDRSKSNYSEFIDVRLSPVNIQSHNA